MADIGKSISESISFISKVGAECELLGALVKQELSSLFSDGPLGKRFQAENWIAASQMDSHEWVYTDIAYSLPLTIKPKRSVGAHLFFQISLAGVGIAAVDNDQPLLHVGVWIDGPADFEELWMGFPLDQEEPEQLKEGTLFTWPAPGKDVGSWVYSLRLAEINTMQDVQAKIVAPVKALLLNEIVSDALPQILQGLVRYRAVENEPGQYQVA